MAEKNKEHLGFKTISSTPNSAKHKSNKRIRIFGLFCLFFSVFLGLSFISYFFTWKQDQVNILNHHWDILFNNVKVFNLTGRTGAFLSHLFFYRGFGISSFFVCAPLFVYGINTLLQRKVFPYYKVLFFSLIGLIYIACFFAFFMPGFSFPMSGNMAKRMIEWLNNLIGFVGTFFLIIIAPFVYIVWQFNPEIKLSATLLSIFKFGWIKKLFSYKPKKVVAGSTDDTKFNLEAIEEEIINTVVPPKPPVTNLFDEHILEENPNFIEPDYKAPTISSAYENLEFKIIEKEREEKISSTAIVIEKDNSKPSLTVHNFYANNLNNVSDDNDVIQIEGIALNNNATSVQPTPNVINLNTTPSAINLTPTPLNSTIENIPLEVNITQDENIKEIEADSSLYVKPTNKVSFINIMSPEIPITNQHNPSAFNFTDPTAELLNFKMPPISLLENYGTEDLKHDNIELQKNKDQIINTLKNYDISIDKISATIGPTVTLYEIVPSAGIRISKIKNLEDDIALSLAALGIRIIAPIPGRGTIGIEVPNIKKSIVSMRNIISSEKFHNTKYALPIALGKTIDNQNYVVDLATMPHMLMAGATGQGKSVGINAILISLLYKKHPSQLKFVMVDPKKVELSIYRTIEKHYLAKLPDEEDAIITDTKKVIYTINALCIEMDNRYDLLKNAGARNIKEYNEKYLSHKLNPELGHKYLPFIVLVIDEFADLIMTAGKEIEIPIARLAQLARAIGIHLIIATQRPSVNIITGIIKANFPVRIAFKVSSKIDSRTILDAGGADQLIGKGDMLISHNGEINRVQCAFVDTPEVDRVVDFISTQMSFNSAFILPEYTDPKEIDNTNLDFDSYNQDANLEEAARLIIQKQVASTSLIQRHLKLGYNRAGRIMDQLESLGIVGSAQGSKPRELKVKTEMELNEILNQGGYE